MKLKNTKKRFLAMCIMAGLISAVAFAYNVEETPDGIVVNDVRNKNGNGVVNISNRTGKDVNVTVYFYTGWDKNTALGTGFDDIEDGCSKDIEVDAPYVSNVVIDIKVR